MIQRRNLLDLALPFIALGLVILANLNPVEAKHPAKPGVIQLK